MRKGSFAPRVRARFCKTRFVTNNSQWCVWLDPKLFGLYVFDIGPLPVPVSLVPDDCTPGLWRYCPGTAAIRWQGEFDALSVFGFWAVEVKTNYDLVVQFRFGLKWTDAALNVGNFMTDWTTNVRDDFNGSTTLQIDNGQAYPGAGVPGWATAQINASVGLSYPQIEAIGIDREDTAPATWTAPDDPW